MILAHWCSSSPSLDTGVHPWVSAGPPRNHTGVRVAILMTTRSSLNSDEDPDECTVMLNALYTHQNGRAGHSTQVFSCSLHSGAALLKPSPRPRRYNFFVERRLDAPELPQSAALAANATHAPPAAPPAVPAAPEPLSAPSLILRHLAHHDVVVFLGPDAYFNHFEKTVDEFLSEALLDGASILLDSECGISADSCRKHAEQLQGTGAPSLASSAGRSAELVVTSRKNALPVLYSAILSTRQLPPAHAGIVFVRNTPQAHRVLAEWAIGPARGGDCSSAQGHHDRECLRLALEGVRDARTRSN